MILNTPKNDWNAFFSQKEIQERLLEIESNLGKRTQAGEIIYPKKEELFRAFELSALKDTRVVILGQDPYHGEGEAHGLAFSVNEGIKIPPSLRNLFKELYSCYPDYRLRRSTDLSDWARQGVLLLNATLTVAKDQANSHSKIGWQELTDEVIKYLNKEKNSVVFVLLGNFAQSKKELIDLTKHKVIETSHPSPLSAHRGFLGSRLYIKINQALQDLGLELVTW